MGGKFVDHHEQHRDLGHQGQPRQHGAVEEDIFDFSPFHVGSASCPVSLSLREVGHWTTTFSSPSRSLRSASREGCIIQYPLDCFRISW